MKYLMLIYTSPRNWAHPSFLYQDGVTDADREQMSKEFEALLTELSESGELVTGVPLTDPAEERTVRVRDGERLTTDGPFAEIKEHLAGYFVLDCANIERVTEIAARFPDARFGRVVIRQVDESVPPAG
ncbi:YciI family protein [Pseudonocardia acaciae]|uniref:YciI family protein n=1 Tax=Pseudonocardia acaciae TaxID=551276 RepID=UPI00048E4AC1|nr:YciI family protein [Pseudonocardia acaciae]